MIHHANTSDQPVMLLEDLHKYYGDGDTRIHVLKGIDLCVKRGEYVSIMGASGSGKSTLLNLLGCLDRSSNGRYTLEGQDVSSLADHELSEIRNEHIGFIFQSFNLIAQLTVLENVEVPLLYSRSKPKGQRSGRELLDLVGLSHRLKHKPAQLSGGERQRVAIARALINNPGLLLADEPTGNLDTKTGEEVMELFNDLSEQGRTIVLITHDTEVAKRSHRQVFIRDGYMLEEGAS